MQNIQCASAPLRRPPAGHLHGSVKYVLGQRLLCSALYSNNLADIFP